MFSRKWEVVYTLFDGTVMDAGKHLFWFRRNADSWARLIQSRKLWIDGSPTNWFVRRRANA